MNIEILVGQIIGPAAAGSAGPVPTLIQTHRTTKLFPSSFLFHLSRLLPFRHLPLPPSAPFRSHGTPIIPAKGSGSLAKNRISHLLVFKEFSRTAGPHKFRRPHSEKRFF